MSDHVLPSLLPPAAPVGRLAAAMASRTATLWVATLLLLMSVALVVGLSLQPPMAGRQSVLLFQPGTGHAEAVAVLTRHGGRLVDAGAGSTLIAIFDRDLDWRDLHAMGVWAAFAPDSLLGCLAAPRSSA